MNSGKLSALWRNLEQRYPQIGGNFGLSFLGVAAMHGVLQFFLYPEINRQLGNAAYGNVLFIISVISVLAIPLGGAVDNARLILRNHQLITNGDCNLSLVIFGAIMILWQIPWACYYLPTGSGRGLMILLGLMIMLRNYSAVEYRIRINYHRYCAYFMMLALGFAIGGVAMIWTHSWLLALILGEASALFFAALTTNLYRRPWFRLANFRTLLNSASTLLLAEIFYNVILNLDRLLLIYLINPLANTQFYVVSLIAKTPTLLVQPLNSLCISYLTQKGETISYRKYRILCGAILLFTALSWLGCVLITPWFIHVFYPEVWGQVKSLIALVCLGQVCGMGGNLLLMVILTFTAPRWQLILQGSYAGIFFILAWVLTLKFGLNGFAWAGLLANVLRLIATFAVGWRGIGQTPLALQSAKGN